MAHTLIEWRGKTQNLKAWAKELGINPQTLSTRLKSRHSLDTIMSTPAGMIRPPITHNGRTQTVAAWARELGMDPSCIRQRLRNRWPVALALDPKAKRERIGLAVTYNGKTQSLSHWAREYGIKRSTLDGRLKKGMSLGEALTTPVGPTACIITAEGRAEEIARGLPGNITVNGTTQTIKAWRVELAIPKAMWRKMRGCGIAPADIIVEFMRDHSKGDDDRGVGENLEREAGNRRGEANARFGENGDFLKEQPA